MGEILVNADDFGLDPAISRGIFHCVEKGWVQSVSILPFDDAYHRDLLQRMAAEFPGVRLGCHLSCIDTPPLLAGTPRFSPQQPAAGNYWEFLRLWARTGFATAWVRAEWRAQIRRLRDLGIQVAHLDSHQHLHLLPGLWTAALALQREYAVPRLRVPYEAGSGLPARRTPAALALHLLARLRYRPGRHHRLLGFRGSMDYRFEAYRGALTAALRHPTQKFELMVHPGFRPASGSPAAAWKGHWESEIEELEKTAHFIAEAMR